ncbi:hypothetical protein IG631_04780 [Alternaria alternata]|nr:hypothetical protein IG631_04780 [Alternaria alternata]
MAGRRAEPAVRRNHRERCDVSPVRGKGMFDWTRRASRLRRESRHASSF